MNYVLERKSSFRLNNSLGLQTKQMWGRIASSTIYWCLMVVILMGAFSGIDLRHFIFRTHEIISLISNISQQFTMNDFSTTPYKGHFYRMIQYCNIYREFIEVK